MKEIAQILGDEAEALLHYRCTGISRDALHLPGADFIQRVVADSDRSPVVLRNLQTIFSHGRLGGTGYLSILPVDQGVEHSAGASFAPNPEYFDPAKIVDLALQGGCNAVASTLGVLSSVSRRFAHRIPFIVKLNHNELLTYPNVHDQTMFASVDQAFDLGALAVGATIYYGSSEARRQIGEVTEAFAQAHELGLVTVLWAYLRNPAFKQKDIDHHAAADLTGQANHLAATIAADIVKQKQPLSNDGYRALSFGMTHAKGVRAARAGPPHRTYALPSRELLHGPRRIDQLWRPVRQGRLASSGAHGGDQQARRRNGSHLRPQGVSETDA